MKVYKIGGSSLDNEDKLYNILKLVNNNEKKIIVVSAIGRYPNPYSTDTLLKQSTYVSKIESDLLVSTGEIISSILLSNYLNKNNIKSISLSPYIFNVKNINKKYINKLFKKYNTIIIPGFIYEKDNELHTMPRGGSTISAALITKKFCKELVIVTDVCGLYTAEPSNIDSLHIPLLTYDQFIKLNKTDRFFPKEAINILKQNKIVTTFIKYDDCSKCSKIIP